MAKFARFLYMTPEEFRRLTIPDIEALLQELNGDDGQKHFSSREEYLRWLTTQH